MYVNLFPQKDLHTCCTQCSGLTFCHYAFCAVYALMSWECMFNDRFVHFLCILQQATRTRKSHHHVFCGVPHLDKIQLCTEVYT